MACGNHSLAPQGSSSDTDIPVVACRDNSLMLSMNAGDIVVEYVGSPSVSRESACEALANLAGTAPTSATHIRLLGVPCVQQAALQQMLERCPRLESLEMPASEQPTSEPLSLAEQGSTQLVAQRLSRPAGAWTLQQLPVSLTQLCLSECGSLHPTSLTHLRGLTALTRLCIRGLRVPSLLLSDRTSTEDCAASRVSSASTSALAAGDHTEETAVPAAGGQNVGGGGPAVGGDSSGGNGSATAAVAEAEAGAATASAGPAGIPCCPVIASLQHWSRLTRLQEVELVGQAGNDPGEPWDTLLPAFLPSLTQLSRLAFHPPMLRDAAAALATLELAPSLARLELGGCGAAALQLHEAAWRVLAAVPALEQLLLGHCDVAVGWALTSSSAREVKNTQKALLPYTAAAGVGLAAAAAAASMSTWATWGAGGGCGGGWIMGAGSSGSGGGGWGSGTAGSWWHGLEQLAVPTTPEDSPIGFGARGSLTWLGGSGSGGGGGAASDGLLGVGLSDLQPIQEWSWGRECAVAAAAEPLQPPPPPLASPAATATSWASGGPAVSAPAADDGSGDGGILGTGSGLAANRWDAGVWSLGGVAADISPASAWGHPAFRGGCDDDEVTEQDVAGLATKAQPSGGGGEGREAWVAATVEAAGEQGGGEAVALSMAPCRAAVTIPCGREHGDGGGGGDGSNSSERCKEMLSRCPRPGWSSPLEGRVEALPAPTSPEAEVERVAAGLASGPSDSAALVPAASEADTCGANVLGAAQLLPLVSAEGIPRPASPHTGVATPTERTSVAVSASEHSCIGSSSVPSSRSSYCINATRYGGTAPSSNARPASEGGYSWCSSCANDDVVVAAAAATAAAAAVAAANTAAAAATDARPAAQNGEGARQHSSPSGHSTMSCTVRDTTSSAASSGLANPGGAGVVGVSTVDGCGGSSSSSRSAECSAVADVRSDGGGGVSVLDASLHEARGVELSGDSGGSDNSIATESPPACGIGGVSVGGSGGTCLGRGDSGGSERAAPEGEGPLPPPLMEPPSCGPNATCGCTGSSTDAGTPMDTASGQMDAIVAMALTAAAAYRAKVRHHVSTIEAGSSAQCSPAHGADAARGAQSTAVAVAAAWAAAASVSNATGTAGYTTTPTAAYNNDDDGDDDVSTPGPICGVDAKAAVSDANVTAWPFRPCQEPCGTEVHAHAMMQQPGDLSSTAVGPAAAAVPPACAVQSAPIVVPQAAGQPPPVGAYSISCWEPTASAAAAGASTATTTMPMTTSAPATASSGSAAVETASTAAAATLASAGSASCSAAAIKRVGSASVDLGRHSSRCCGGDGGGSGSFFPRGGLPKLAGGRGQMGLSFSPFSSLRRLSLLSIGDADFIQLTSCTSLQGGLLSLSLSDCSDLGEGSMKSVPKLRRLEQLSLRGLRATFDAIMGSWTGLSELRALEVGLSPAAAAALAAAADRASGTAAAAMEVEASDAAAAAPSLPPTHTCLDPAGPLLVPECGEPVVMHRGGCSVNVAPDGLISVVSRTAGERAGLHGSSGGGMGDGCIDDGTWGKWPSPASAGVSELAGLQAALCGSACGVGEGNGDGAGGGPPPQYEDELDAAVRMVAEAGGFNSDADDIGAGGGSTYAEAMYGSASSRSDMGSDEDNFFGGNDLGGGGAGGRAFGFRAAADGVAVPVDDLQRAPLSPPPRRQSRGSAAAQGAAANTEAMEEHDGIQAGIPSCQEIGADGPPDAAPGGGRHQNFIPVFSVRPMGRRYRGSSDGFEGGGLDSPESGGGACSGGATAAATDVGGCMERRERHCPTTPAQGPGGFSSAASTDGPWWDVAAGTAVRWAAPVAVQYDVGDGGGGTGGSGDDGRVHGERRGLAAVMAAGRTRTMQVQRWRSGDDGGSGDAAGGTVGGFTAAATEEASPALAAAACALADNGLHVLLQLLPKLKELYLHNLPNLTPSTVERVLSRPGLRALVVDGCRHLTPDVCDILAISVMDLTMALGAGEGKRGEGAGLRLRLVPA